MKLNVNEVEAHLQ